MHSELLDTLILGTASRNGFAVDIHNNIYFRDHVAH